MQNTRTNTRTRPSAGSASFAQQPPAMAQQPYQYPQYPDQTDYSNFNFSAPLPNDQLYPTANVYDGNNLAYNFNASQPPTYPTNLAPAPSTELVRRSRDQQLAPLNGDQQEQWNGYSGIDPHSVEDEDEQDLDMKVALAKKDAQGKRKQIPPFVQKLSSFLDSNNTDLIRWSDDGRSFIVLDEDEFARTLIPELFKHNNYASFVRQLNMYGFHKTVNITDGSLRQSEKARKGVKPPSMYSHPYFRKNRPDLLWLIQKPAGTKSAKRKRDGNLKDPYDSDEGSPVPETFGGPPQQLSAPNANTNQDLVQLPRNELAAVRKELQGLQTQQKFISEMIARLKEQNDRQAKNFQALHDRHENSINAILTFLATFYNRSLEGHGGAANLVNMFASAMPQTHQPQTGSVVEEFNDTTPVATPSNQVQRFIKRPPLLLPGPVENQHLQPGSAVTEPSSARGSASPTNDLSSRGRNGSAPPESARPQSAATSPATIKTDAPTPNVLNQVPESNDQMMNLINNVNASTAASTPSTLAPAVDMNSIVDRINQSNSPLTPQQREDMVNTLSQNNLDSTAGALSNWNTSNADFQRRMDESQNTLDYLQQLQKQQDEKVQELNRRLQPLSPTGTIPGLHHFDNSNLDPFDQLGAPSDYNVNDYVNFDDPAPWDHGGDGGGGTDFDFGNTDWTNFNADEGVDNMFGATNDQSADRLAPNQGDGGRVESVSSEATSPADGATGVDEPGTPNKRARRS